jgi:hypothetical protein
VVVEDVEAGAGRLEAKHRTASATSEGAVARAKSMARLRDSLPKAASSLVLVGAMLLPCSSSAYSSTVLNFAAPPCLAPRAVPATACHLDRQGLFAGRQLLRQSRGLERAGTASRGSARVMRTSGVRNMLAMEPIEEMRDYSEDDALGRRLFVTGLASSIDDVRLYLAFEGFGRIVEAHVAKPVHNGYMLYEVYIVHACVCVLLWCDVCAETLSLLYLVISIYNIVDYDYCFIEFYVDHSLSTILFLLSILLSVFTSHSNTLNCFTSHSSTCTCT